MPYNGYNESRKKSTLKYMKEKMKIINLRIPKDKYEQDVEPYIKSSGLPMATFIKCAMQEKINRDYDVQINLTDTNNSSISSENTGNNES